MEISNSGLVLNAYKAKSDESILGASFSASEGNRFHDLVAADRSGSDPTPEDGIRGASVTQLPATASLGDRILNGLTALSGDFERSWTSVSSVLGVDRSLSMQDMLKVQTDLVRASVNFQLVGKAILKSASNIEQVIKVQ